ncbi:MAG: GNAT family N-acetyltransferase [Erysipelotrichaceae bacterium]|nr:GNAT family N-acetyltransferase [Erysipelotrichaceae bacterium]
MLRRPYKYCDAKTIVTWIKDERSLRLWSVDFYDSYPITEYDMIKLYHSYDNQDNYYVFTVYDEKGLVSHLIMRFIDNDKSIIRFGFIIIDNKLRSRNYGKQVVRLAVQYAFEFLKVKKITLGVFKNNVTAYHCYKSIGFKEVDSEKEYYQYHDETWKCVEMILKR